MPIKNLTKLLGTGLCSVSALFPSDLHSNPSGAGISICNFPGNTMWSLAALECDGPSLTSTPPYYSNNGNTLGVYVSYAGINDFSVLSATEEGFPGNTDFLLGFVGKTNNMPNYLNFNFYPSFDNTYPSNYLTTAEIMCWKFYKRNRFRL